MKIYIENEVLEYGNNKEEIAHILEEIDNIISKHSKILSHMVIDEVELYEDYYNYFVENIRVIEKIEVISNTYKDLVENILITTMDYTSKIQSEIERLSNSFYTNPHRQAWNDLEDFLGGVSWIIDTFSVIDQDARLKEVVLSYESWNYYAQEVSALSALLPDFESALTSGDHISIADILSYEILSILNEMVIKLSELLNLEGQLNDFS